MYGCKIIMKLNELTWKVEEWTKDDLIDIIEDYKLTKKNSLLKKV